MKPLRIALSKGRVASAAKAKLLAGGYRFPSANDRLLVITDETHTLELLLLKAQDVPIYVEKGVADLGIVGSDILREYNADVFELSQLDFGLCQMCLCASPSLNIKTLDYVRLASKYPAVAEAYLNQRHLPGEVTYLSGSVELAPILGVSDFIVDIVESGKTLAAHGLVIHEKLFDISSVLIANKIRYKLYFEAIKPIMAALLPTKEGLVATDGWTHSSKIAAEALIAQLMAEGFESFIYTDISKDGTLSSPNFNTLKSLLSLGEIKLIASGGVGSLRDLATLKSMGLSGAIVGKALLDGLIDPREALEVCHA